MSILRLLPTLLAGCAAAAVHPAASTSPRGAPASTTRSEPRCPKGLERRLHRAWRLDADQRVAIQECRTGRFPDRGWFIIAWVETPELRGPDPEAWRERDSWREHVLVRARGPIADDTGSDVVLPGPAEVTLVDFDGDGVDEALERRGSAWQGDVEEVLTIWRLDRGRLHPILELVTKLDDFGGPANPQHRRYASHCQASFTITPTTSGAHALVITGSTSQGPDAAPDNISRCVNGTRSYTLTGGQFVAQ